MEFIIKSESGKTRRFDSKSIQNAMIEYFKVTEEKPVRAELRAYDKDGERAGGMTWNQDQLRGCLPPPKPSKESPGLQFTMTDLLADAHFKNPRKQGIQ